MRVRATWIVALCLLMVAGSGREGWCERDGPLEGSLKAYVVTTDARGEEVLGETESIQPGQTVEYVLEYKNVSDGVLRGLELTGPVPEATQYLDGTATETDFMGPVFSINKGQTFARPPLKYTVTLADGTEEERTATPDMYTHVRWRVPELAAGAVVRLSYRVLVE